MNEFKKTSLIVDFFNVAKVNGAELIEVALPVNHPVIKTHVSGLDVRQIRKVKDVLARYSDEIGNVVVLTTEGLVKQI